MTPTDVCNLALSEVGSRILLNSLTDDSPQAKVAKLNYGPRIKALLRAANWDFARAQVTLTVFKAAIINGVVSANPPPQPFRYSYLKPTDCLKVRFILPTVPTAAAGVPLTTAPNVGWAGCPAPTGIPFVMGTDLDVNNNPIEVILTSLPHAQGVYTRDLSQVPDVWDSLFSNAATAYLGAYFIQSLERNSAIYQQQSGLAKAAIDEARMANANESLSSIDHTPDWLRARHVSGFNWAYNGGGPGAYGPGAFDSLSMPDGQRF